MVGWLVVRLVLRWFVVRLEMRWFVVGWLVVRLVVKWFAVRLVMRWFGVACGEVAYGEAHSFAEKITQSSPSGLKRFTQKCIASFDII